MSLRPEAAARLLPEERALVDELRCELNNVMPEGIPEDLDTDLNLARWIRGYQKNIEKIVETFPVYVASRKAAGFEGENFTNKFFEMPHIKPHLQFIASSRLSDRVWSEEHNAFLFVERAWSQPKEFVKAMRCSDYLLHCFGYSEFLLQRILHREKMQKDDPNKGPVQFLVIFDLAEVNLSEYLNPMSAHIRLWQLRSDLWQNWYPEMVQRIFLVNPPRLVSMLWRMAKMFLNDRNFKLIEIVENKKDIHRHLPLSFVPREYGGEFVNNVPPGDETGVSVRRKIVADDHIRSFETFRRRGLERPKTNRQEIAAGEAFTCVMDVAKDHGLIWYFTTNCDVEFTIYVENNEREMVYPRLRLTSTKVPEEGLLENLPPQKYLVEFFNASSFFNLKLDYYVSTFPL